MALEHGCVNKEFCIEMKRCTYKYAWSVVGFYKNPFEYGVNDLLIRRTRCTRSWHGQGRYVNLNYHRVRSFELPN